MQWPVRTDSLSQSEVTLKRVCVCLYCAILNPGGGGPNVCKMLTCQEESGVSEQQLHLDLSPVAKIAKSVCESVLPFGS